ncbi:MAG: ABC transporter permease subunit, partial [Litorivicinus sp.]
MSIGQRLYQWWDSDFFYAFRTSPVAIVAFSVVMLLFGGALLAPLLSVMDPFDMAALNLMNGFTPPMQPNAFTGDTFLLGTDDQGRDLWSAILHGLRVSLFVGFSAVGLAMAIGISLGLLAGYLGGWVDALIMRVADVQVTFPSILIAMLIFGIARGLLPPEARNDFAIWV